MKTEWLTANERCAIPEGVHKKIPTLFLENEGGVVGLVFQMLYEALSLQKYLKQNVQTIEYGQEHAHAPVFAALSFSAIHIQFHFLGSGL